MKTKINVLILLVAVIMVSCRNDKYGMVTVINGNGSCNRELTFRLDSDQLVSGKIHFSQGVCSAGQEMEDVVGGWRRKIRHSFPMTRQQYDSIENSLRDSDKGVCDVVTVVASSSWDNVEMAQNTNFTLKGSRLLRGGTLSLF